MIQIDIEMPTTCLECPLHDGEYGWCNLNYDITMDCEKRPKECPLHEVTDSDTISRPSEENCDTCEYGESGSECDNCRVGYPSHYKRKRTICGACNDSDSKTLYATDPPQVRCKKSGKLHFVTDYCDSPPSLSRPQWIPCSERLPEEEVLCCDTRGEMIIGYPYQDEESNTGYSAVLDDIVMIDCTAWMPLPEPYQGK